MGEENLRYAASELEAFATALTVAAGIPADRAARTAHVLVEGDLLGQTTHGLAQLSKYISDIEKGGMKVEGDWEIVKDLGANITIDAHRHSGTWIMEKAVDLALERSREHGVVTLSIRRAHHIAALSAYLPRIAEAGRMAILMASDPTTATIAAFGSKTPLYAPNPIAAVFPTKTDPVLIDISMSSVTMGMVARLRGEGRLFDYPHLLDADGQPTRDPAVMAAKPRGSVLPVGGMENGHKGYAMGLIVEALTNALGGHGRSAPAEGWGTSIFFQVIDPAAFAGMESFLTEMAWMVEAVAAAAPVDPDRPPRIPGQRALALRKKQLDEGVRLYPSIMPSLKPYAEKWNIPMPAPLD